MSHNITDSLKSFKDVLCSSQNSEMKLKALQSIRILLSSHDDTSAEIQAVIDQGLVPILVDFLKDFDNSTAQLEASWALCNVAFGTAEQVNTVIDAGAVPLLTALLRSPVTDVSKQAVWALGNIAGEGPEASDVVIQSGVINHLLWLLEKDNLEISFRRSIVWSMANLTVFIRSSPLLEVNKMIPALVKMLQMANNDNKILSHACWTLSRVIGGDPEKIQAVIDLGCVGRIVRLMDCDDVKVAKAALRVVAIIVEAGNRQIDHVLSANVLPNLAKLLNHTDEFLVKESALTLRNITAGTQQQIQTVLESGILGVIQHIFASGNSASWCRAAWVIANIIMEGTTLQVNGMMLKHAELFKIPSVSEMFIAIHKMKVLDDYDKSKEEMSLKAEQIIDAFIR